MTVLEIPLISILIISSSLKFLLCLLCTDHIVVTTSYYLFLICYLSLGYGVGHCYIIIKDKQTNFYSDNGRFQENECHCIPVSS